MNRFFRLQMTFCPNHGDRKEHNRQFIVGIDFENLLQEIAGSRPLVQV